MKTLNEMVAKGQRVTFLHYRAKELWYVTDTGFTFPVPISDVGDATFLNNDKALLFMRYIRKHMDALKDAGSHEI